MKLNLFIILSLLLIGSIAQEANTGKNNFLFNLKLSDNLWKFDKALKFIDEGSITKEIPQKKHQATYFKIFALIFCLSVAAYGLNYLNKMHKKHIERRLTDEDFGKFTVPKIDISKIVDTSTQIELYAEDGKSGLLDIYNKCKTEPEVYEMISYESSSKQLKEEESSFMSNASVRTSDDIELHGFDKQQNDYEVPDVYPKKWSMIGNFFSNQRESLL